MRARGIECTRGASRGPHSHSRGRGGAQSARGGFAQFFSGAHGRGEAGCSEPSPRSSFSACANSGSPVENALRRDEVLRRAPVSKSRQSRGRPMRWNSKLAKNSSKKATSRLIEHPLPTPSEPPPPSPPSSLPPRGPPSQPSSVRARPQPPRGSSVVASFNVSFTGNQGGCAKRKPSLRVALLVLQLLFPCAASRGRAALELVPHREHPLDDLEILRAAPVE